jgi:anti-anti-sigma factor
MDFFSALSLCAPRAHLLAKGELDAFAATALYHRLDEAIDHGCISYTVDASAVTFVDAGGLGMLVRLSNAVAPFGGSVTVSAASPRFRQVAELAELGSLLGLDLVPADRPHSPAPTGRREERSSPHRLILVPAHPARATAPHVSRADARCLRMWSAR